MKRTKLLDTLRLDTFLQPIAVLVNKPHCNKPHCTLWAMVGQLLCLVSLFSISAPGYAAPHDEAPAYKAHPKSIELNEKGAAAIHAKDGKLAVQLFRQAMEADPKNLTAVYNLAGAYVAEKQESKAIELLEDYVHQYPDAVDLLVRAGDVYFSARDMDKAFTRYSQAYQKNPQYEGLAAKLGTLHTVKGNLEKAEAMLEEASSRGTPGAELLANLSAVQLANNKPGRAITNAKRALHQKVSSDVYVTLGAAYEAKKDYKNALIALKRARDLGDNDEQLDEKISQLEELMNNGS